MFEPRIKACVAWGAIWDYGAIWQRGWEQRSKSVSVPFFQLPWVMGTPTREAALERVKQWTLADVFPKLKQPFLIVHGAEDKAIPIEDAHQSICSRRIFGQTICDWFAKKL
jgi:pimeloyl-ACP methyl ester carboxylesterase